MSQTYFAILTAIGEAKLANATALGTTLQLTQMGIGDGNGSTPLPNRSQTALVRENRRAPLNRLFVDPANASQIIAEQVIPEEIGGWWIREIGLYDTDGNLCAVANCPDTYKPVLAEGSGRTQVIRMVLIVSNTAAVQLKIDPAIVLATRGYVDDEFGKHLAALDPHPVYLTGAEGDAKIAAALVSPMLSGNPTAPTAPQFDKDTSIATTEFVQRALGNYSGYFGFTGSTTLSATHAGAYIKFTIPVASIASLPSSVPLGVKFTVTNAISSSATLTVAIPGGIGSVLAGGNATSFTLTPGSQVDLVHIGDGFYEAINGSGSAALGSTGFQKLPSGVILQWGSAMASVADFFVTFPIAFPAAVASLSFGNNEARYGYHNNFLTTAGFRYANRDLASGVGVYPDNFFWMAVGY